MYLALFPYYFLLFRLIFFILMYTRQPQASVGLHPTSLATAVENNFSFSAISVNVSNLTLKFNFGHMPMLKTYHSQQFEICSLDMTASRVLSFSLDSEFS